MDVLKRARTQYRRIFTKACNEFEKEETNLNDEVKLMKLNIIEEKAILMIETEMKIRDELYAEAIQETEREAEFDESEAYIDRWRALQQKLKKLSLSQNEDSVSSIDTSQKNTLLRYPKIQLPSFNGDIRQWLGFWGQFQKIDKDPNLDLHDKFSYLSQAMVKGSTAYELIKSFPPGGDSYERALNQLKSRFGKEDLLIQVYIRDLLALVLKKGEARSKPLRVLHDLLETKLRALEILGVTRDKYASMLFPLIESSLPEETLIAWERRRSTNRRIRRVSEEDITEKTDLSSILEFLQDEVEAEERITLASESFNYSKMKSFPREDINKSTEKKLTNKLKFGNAARVSTAAELLTSSKREKQCIFCSNSHNSADCLKVRRMPVKEREMLVGKSHSCFLCLRSGHPVRLCNVKAGCLCCGKRHHILLCRNIQPPTTSSSENVASDEKPHEDSALANVSKSPNVMLQTLMVIIRGNGKRRKARTIIDSASQRSYILKDTAKEMKYKAEGVEYLQHALFGGKNTGVYKHGIFKLFLTSVNGEYNCNFTVLSQPIICETKPPTINELCMKELLNFNVHVEDDHQAPIEILIGADIAGKLMTGGYKLLSSGLAAIETRLGWTIMGRTLTATSSDCPALISMMNKDASIADLWSLDSLGITDPSEKKTKQELQEAAISHFLSTVKVENDRFVVNLPWLENHRSLSDNYELAFKRLLECTLEKLKTDDEQVFEKWLKEGIIEEVPSDERYVPCHYLLHRHVVNENSTTRIRPVFDASSKKKGSPNLNECLEKGPNLIEIPRWIKFGDEDEKRSLHVFCDASQSAYATYAFPRDERENSVHIQLIQAKAGVPGTMNPADLPSRGCTAQQLSMSKWWEGPEWLYSPSVLWPTTEDAVREDEVNSERTRRIVSSMLTVEVGTLLSSRTNNYTKIINIVAWIKRFIHNSRNSPKKVGEVTVSEAEEAEKTIVRLIQRESFTDKKDKRLKTLDTFLVERIIRLKTVVFRRDDHEEFRTPAILPGEHPIVRSLVLEVHKKKGHAGVSYTLNSLREKFWILCGRRTVKSVIRSCNVCNRYAAKNNVPPTTPPPTDRVQDARVFQVIGTDFAGPIILRDNSKAWICLFTCAVYRAVHLELVTSLSTETFLLAFHRFVARRGKPSIVYSDNAKNFTGAANALACVDFDKVAAQTREEKITWKFIPPGAPWWGGWWERLIGLMKTILKKILGKASMSHEEMTTVLCNCEAILNDRPLTAVTSDPSLTALTPADFLKEIRNDAIPDIKADTNPNFLRRRLRYIQTVREAFRARFRQEYLGVLRIKQKKCEFSPLKKGDIVLIEYDDKKKQFWPLGRIIEVFPGVDGVVRRVKVKTQSGVLFRAAQKIYPLEISSSEADTNDVYPERVESEQVRLSTTEKLKNEESCVLPTSQKTRVGRVIKEPERLNL